MTTPPPSSVDAQIGQRYRLHAGGGPEPIPLRQQLQRETARRHQAEQALHEARSELARAARINAMGTFAATIAHELAQPLAAATLHADAALNWLRQQPPGLDQACTALEQVRHCTSRAAELVRGAGNLARKGGPQRAAFCVDAAISEVLCLMDAELHRHGIALRTSLALGPARMVGERAQLQQVVMNLILNAIEAMADVSERPRTLELHSWTTPADGALAMSVRDNGCGIGPGAAARLFEPLHSTKAGGMGMGLSLCRAIVDAHGGAIWCDTDQRHGCTFHLTLPAADAARPARQHSDHRHHETPACPPSPY
jgi:C4-dicarboxylate-specific signal transduction histidine kinase